MPLALFASRSFVGITLLTLMLYAALAGLLVLVPYVLIEEAGYSAVAAGAALLPFPLVIATTSPMIGALAGAIGARIPLIAGPLIVAAGFVLYRLHTGLNRNKAPAFPHKRWARHRTLSVFRSDYLIREGADGQVQQRPSRATEKSAEA